MFWAAGCTTSTTRPAAGLRLCHLSPPSLSTPSCTTSGRSTDLCIRGISGRHQLTTQPAPLLSPAMQASSSQPRYAPPVHHVRRVSPPTFSHTPPLTPLQPSRPQSILETLVERRDSESDTAVLSPPPPAATARVSLGRVLLVLQVRCAMTYTPTPVASLGSGRSDPILG